MYILLNFFYKVEQVIIPTIVDIYRLYTTTELDPVLQVG